MHRRIIASLLLVLSGALPSSAATPTVTSLADDGTPGTLRSVLASANTGDTINFRAGLTGTITLALGTLGITKSVSIAGPGAAKLTISGANAFTVFSIDPYITVGISGVTIANGHNPYQGGWGGGIVTKGTLAVDAVTFSGNYAPNGGGIFSYSNNLGLTVTNSTFVGNSAGWGGAIWSNPNAATTVINSTFSGNHATYVGGAIDNMGGYLWLSFSTFSGNSAPQGGNIATSTNFLYSPGYFVIKNTLLANSSGGNCYFGTPTTVVSEDHNLSDDASCARFFTGTGDLNSTPAGLDPSGPQNNGGQTQTIALLSGSPAIDAIPVTACSDTGLMGATPRPVTADQRGVPRAQGAGCDIGAYEYAPILALVSSLTTTITSLNLGPQLTAFLLGFVQQVPTTVANMTTLQKQAAIAAMRNLISVAQFLPATVRTTVVGLATSILAALGGTP